MYRFMSKQFIALFAGLLVLCSVQFISPPKMRGLILRRKTGTVSVEVFPFSNGAREPKDVSFTFVQCLFCKNSSAFRADFFCINVTVESWD